MARILVIDDDEPFLKIVLMMLERAGHEVVVATSGMEGLREFKRSAVSLVLCDLYMPDMDGLDMLTTLRKIKSDLPVIIMSGAPPKSPGRLRRGELPGNGRAAWRDFDDRKTVSSQSIACLY